VRARRCEEPPQEPSTRLGPAQLGLSPASGTKNGGLVSKALRNRVALDAHSVCLCWAASWAPFSGSFLFSSAARGGRKSARTEGSTSACHWASAVRLASSALGSAITSVGALAMAIEIIFLCPVVVSRKKCRRIYSFVSFSLSSSPSSPSSESLSWGCGEGWRRSSCGGLLLTGAGLNRTRACAGIPSRNRATPSLVIHGHCCAKEGAVQHTTGGGGVSGVQVRPVPT
jgi:hypothetical protein